MPFQPGNAEGAKSRKAKPYADALRLEIAKADGDVQVLRRIAQRHVARCMEGDMSAIKEMADRIDGKVPQAISGTDDSPLQIEMVRRIIVTPGNTDSGGVPPST